MESFGLFQILHSFLSQKAQNEAVAEESFATENKERLEESATQSKAANDLEPESDSTNDAFLSFMQAHEARAKRIKKL